MKLGILVCGACGFASTFLGEPSVWAGRGALGPAVYLYAIGFLLAAGVVAWRFDKPLLRWHAIVALIGTCLTLLVHRGALGALASLGPVREHTLGSLLYAVGLYGGLIVGIGAVAKPERA